MRNSEIIEGWLQLIRQHKNHDEEIITKIMYKHNMKNTPLLAVSLGNYYDHLTESPDAEWLQDHNERYEIQEADQEASNRLWDKLENELLQEGTI